jgi:hypothetical protein
MRPTSRWLAKERYETYKQMAGVKEAESSEAEAES